VSSCIGDPCDEIHKSKRWRRSDVDRDTFIDVYLDRSDDVICEADGAGFWCRTFAGGWGADYTWRRQGAGYFLSEIAIQSH
jgi:hypothetical protein